MIDLDQLGHLHPDLPDELAGALVMYGSVALERQRHAPGVDFVASIRGRTVNETLVWRVRSANDAQMVDINRVTADGAECLALLIVGLHCSWRAVRRLQWRLGEGADWLVEEAASGEGIVLEVSGTDEGPLEPRIRKKKAQAQAAAGACHAAACVVRFLEPTATLWNDHDPRPGAS